MKLLIILYTLALVGCNATMNPNWQPSPAFDAGLLLMLQGMGAGAPPMQMPHTIHCNTYQYSARGATTTCN